jgi:hypothetical protein
MFVIELYGLNIFGARRNPVAAVAGCPDYLGNTYGDAGVAARKAISFP